MGREGLEYIIHHTVVTSHNGWLITGNTYRGIVLDGEDWCDVRHGRLIITPDGKKNTIV